MNRIPQAGRHPEGHGPVVRRVGGAHDDRQHPFDPVHPVHPVGKNPVMHPAEHRRKIVS